MKPPRTRDKTPPSLPTLRNGERMKQPEFHRRYEEYPEDVKIELIGGVVHMPSPTRGPHGRYLLQLSGVLFLYTNTTPGTDAADNITAILGEESEPQPDLLLRLAYECGGQSRYDEKQYLTGAPELVAEVAHSSRDIDLHNKRDDYLAAGVQEYLVLCVEEEEIHWFHFPSKSRLKPDRAGIWKSQVFPGLWIEGPALIARDSARLIATLQKGLASPKHASFVRQLEKRRKR
jgi:Uma2 family endonuclease